MDKCKIIISEESCNDFESPVQLSPLEITPKLDTVAKENGKTVDVSSTMMTKLIRPSHTDSRGYVYGGQILSWIDIIASIAARRHTENSCVTRSVDAVHFLHPIHAGDVVVFKATVNRSWKTSMEVGVRVEAESPFSGKREFCCHAYLTFVALKTGEENNVPKVVPSVIPNTASEIRRFETAERRRQKRLQLAKESTPSIALREKLLSVRAFDPVVHFSNITSGESKEMFSTYGEIVELVLPQHANTLQITFGGQIMEWMEYCAVVCALRMSRSNLLTASVDTLQFIRPTYVGNVITVRGVVTTTYKSSMEVYVTVAAEDIKTGEIQFTNDGFFTVVAVDDKNCPVNVGNVLPKDKAEITASNEAQDRRMARLSERRLICSQSVQTFRSSGPVNTYT